jgi:hypothetical protein
MIDASFKKSTDDQTLYFPWGVLGRGYIVPSTIEDAKIRKFLGVYYIASFIIIVGGIVLLGIIFTAILLIPILAWYAIRAKGFVKVLAVSSERMTYKESSISVANKMPIALLITFLVLSLLFTVGGLAITLTGQSLLGILVVLFFGACSFVYVRMIKAKRRLSKK